MKKQQPTQQKHLLHKNNRSGFTLIELLVVIAIVGTLSSVVLTNLSEARARANDVKRLQDMEQIRIALELFHQDYGRYPGIEEGIDLTGAVIGAGYSIDVALSPYIDPVPTDPRYDGGFGQANEQPVAGALYFYGYDHIHLISNCPDTERVGIAIAYGFNRAESDLELPAKETCAGPGMNLNNADYNKLLDPVYD